MEVTRDGRSVADLFKRMLGAFDDAYTKSQLQSGSQWRWAHAPRCQPLRKRRQLMVEARRGYGSHCAIRSNLVSRFCC